MTADVALAVVDLQKAYGANRALDGVNLEVRAGEVHALLGQNGCGKSTLVKSLTGVVNPDHGEIQLWGEKLNTPVSDAANQGIAVIHQDLGLVESMTVLENLGIVARYGGPLLSPVNVRRERRIYRDLLERLDIDLDLDARVATLSSAERALLGVVRAFRLIDARGQKGLFILDEPTAALSATESRVVLRLMRRVADLGFAVVFISHRLQEVMEICDHATVMRAGRDVLHTPILETTRVDLVSAMLGRRLEEFFPSPPPLIADPLIALEVVDLVGGGVRGIDLTLHAGEIVGITGLAGMGQDDLPELLSGSRPPRSGSILINGHPVTFGSPAGALKRGIALVPGNRLRDGVWVAGTAEENVTLPVLSRLRRRWGLDGRRLRASAQERMSVASVHPANPDLPLSGFSGGNQQKIVFSKWMQLSPTTFLLHEPTQGVDPGSAKELLGSVMELAAGGAAIAVFSGDYEQLAEICHRVVVMQHGVVVAELSGAELTEENLLRACEDEERVDA